VTQRGDDIYFLRANFNKNTLHQPIKTGNKVGEMIQQIKTFFHNHQGVFMWNETGCS